MTTSAPRGGGAENKLQTDGEEARGGERDARAGKVVVDMELKAGEYRRGEIGGDQNHQWTGKKYHIILAKRGPESSDLVAAVLGLESQ